MTLPVKNRLKYNNLRRKISMSEKKWKQLRDKPDAKYFIGQKRALEAFELGIGNKDAGYNIYVSGYPGSGKLKAINNFIKQRAEHEASPGDLCYVNNFKDPYCPKRIHLVKGGALIFKNEIEQLIEEASEALIKAFESKEYANKRQDIADSFKQQEIDLFKKIYEKASANNFAISRTPIEIIVVPVDVQGNPISDAVFRKYNKTKQDELISKRDLMMEELKSLQRQNRQLERKRNTSLIELDNSVATYAIELLLEELRDKYNDNNDVLEYLDAILEDIIKNLRIFLQLSEEKSDMSSGIDKKWTEYDVNIITDSNDLKGAPIILEFNPTYNNLFGKVEHESDMGTLVTDFTLIRGGSLHKANGGYLIIPVKELLMNYFSWESFKRALNDSQIVIEDASERFGFMTAKSLKPEPIPLQVQIILIGSPFLYYLLYKWDEDFKELFRVKAEFDTSMDYSMEHVNNFVSVIFKIEKEDNLLPVSRFGMIRILEEGCRMAQDRKKISIRFGELSKILQEANYYALKDEKKEILKEHIVKAVEYKYYRSNLVQEKINELIKRNTLKIELEGMKTGQINGISVIDIGDVMFGRPNKISVTVASGKGGLIDIEREVKLGGPIHSKGVLILNGFLRDHYAQDKSISIVASLVFEQSYGEIEGDSASSAELYAILSGLSQLPIRQGIAVTGSVNQKGEVQAVGAINEKIEGYFEVCNQFGLNGEQGVIIPRSNMDNLMLKPQVVDAVRDGMFHIWAIETIDQGLEILTGYLAGKKLKKGSFTKNSVHDLVDQRIRELGENLKRNK